MRKVFLLLSSILLISLLIGFVGLLRWSEKPIFLSKDTIFVLEAGQGFLEVSDNLSALGFDIDRRLFFALAKLEGVDRSLRAGTYEIPMKISPARLLEIFSQGTVKLFEFRINEGWNFQQLRKQLRANHHILDTLGQGSVDEIRNQLQIEYPYVEGAFFPDTYAFESGTKDTELLERAHRAMILKASGIWEQFGSTQVNLESLSEMLIMGSLIEKETGRAEDRPLISQVFHKRLKKNMRLQTDPTVIFALGDTFDGNLTRRNLRIQSPYNTYRNRGLPPTPIAFPSEASLLAAVNPAKSEYLYFVARGDGSSQFSRTLREHNAAVRKYQLK